MKDIKKELLTLVAITATIGVLWITNRPVIPKEAIWDDVVTRQKWAATSSLIPTNSGNITERTRIAFSLWIPGRNGSIELAISRVPLTFPWSRPGCRVGKRRGTLRHY